MKNQTLAILIFLLGASLPIRNSHAQNCNTADLDPYRVWYGIDYANTCTPPVAKSASLPTISAKSTDVSAIFSGKYNAILTESKTNQCPLSLLYGPDRDNNFKINFDNGVVKRRGALYSSSYYTRSSANCSTDSNGSMNERVFAYFGIKARYNQPLFPETIYAISPSGDFYIVDICEGNNPRVRRLNDALPSNVTQAAQSCQQAGYTDVQNDLSGLEVPHTSLLSDWVELVSHKAERTGAVARTALISGSVAGAGTILVNQDGKVAAISNCSGHYQPPRQMLDNGISILKSYGVLAGPLVNNSVLDIGKVCSMAFFSNDSQTKIIYDAFVNYIATSPSK